MDLWVRFVEEAMIPLEPLESLGLQLPEAGIKYSEKSNIAMVIKHSCYFNNQT